MDRPRLRRAARFVSEMVELYFSKNVSRSAAELAYFLILSFFPILICVNYLIGTLHVNAAQLLEGAAGIIPGEVVAVLSEYIRYITENQSPALLLGGLGMTVFSASAAIRALMNVMDDIYGKKSYAGVWQLVASVVFAVLFLAIVYLSVVVLLTGNWFFRLVEGVLRRIPALAGVRLPWQWQWLRFLVLFCLVMAFVMLLYRATAPRGKPRPPVLLGAFLASAALVGASILFSYFIGLSSRYSLVYGSLASVIILLVWLYLCGNIIILGSCFNRVWYRRRASGGQKN